MRCKVRYVSRHRSGSVAYSDQFVEVPGRRIGVGRGADNDVFLKDLRVNYRHADIVARDYDVVIEAVGPSVLRVDGVPVERGVITPETEVDLGPYRLQLLPGEPDADLALAVELVAPPPTDTVKRLIEPRRVQLGGGLKRPLSWLLFLLVIAVGLALPILAHRLSEPDRFEAETGNSLVAGFDRVWISGELSSSHKILGNDCRACHETAFVRVRSEACASCHADTQHHFDTARFEFAGFAPTNCTRCHSEHQGPDGVVPRWQRLCADCHRDLSRQAPQTKLVDAADFGAAHPQFRPSVITDPASGQVERVALGAPDFPKETSNLRFPHHVHLADRCELPGAVPAPEPDGPTLEARQKCNVLQMARQRMGKDDGLSCGDCHRPEPGGVNMLPVRMRDHCAECHRLEFDENAPDRVLPHGQPDEVIAVINDYYAARALRSGSAAAAAEPPVARQRPGGAAAREAEAERRNPLRDAEEIAARKLNAVFGRSLCGVCHEIIPPAESERGQWEVRPVRVAPLWMPKAHFTHAAHSTTPCVDCHEATESETSADVLMPGIETCRTCHLGEHASTALPSTCIMCHVYHREDLDPMMPRAVQAATTTAR